MTDLLPILLLLAFGLLAWWLWHCRLLNEWAIRVVAAIAGSVLLYDAITEPSRRYSSLFFVFLSAVLAWRASNFVRNRKDPLEVAPRE